MKLAPCCWLDPHLVITFTIMVRPWAAGTVESYVMNSLHCVCVYIFFLFLLRKTPKRTMMNWVTSGLFYAMSYFILFWVALPKSSLFEVFSIVQCLAKLFLSKQIKRQIILLDALLDFKYPSMCPTWNVMQLAAVSAQKFL